MTRAILRKPIPVGGRTLSRREVDNLRAINIKATLATVVTRTREEDEGEGAASIKGEIYLLETKD